MHLQQYLSNNEDNSASPGEYTLTLTPPCWQFGSIIWAIQTKSTTPTDESTILHQLEIAGQICTFRGPSETSVTRVLKEARAYWLCHLIANKTKKHWFSLANPSSDESTILLRRGNGRRCLRAGEDTADEQEKLSNAMVEEGWRGKEEEGWSRCCTMLGGGSKGRGNQRN